MKIVIPGGNGHVGQSLVRHFRGLGDEVIVISRSNGDAIWDGRTLGDWVRTLDGADVVINLAGRSVNCRYTAENLNEMLRSRVDSTRIVGEAIALAKSPPPLWIQASTATIYSHRFDAPNDDESGILGGSEPELDPKWKASIDIAKAWERALDEANTPLTRRVAIRSAMTMSNVAGSVFDVMWNLSRRGLFGTAGTGNQFVSWIHEADFLAAIDFIVAHHELAGAVNLSAPNPIPNHDFNRILRAESGSKMGMSMPGWTLEIGARLLRTETELILKSRRVVPTRLLRAGFRFQFETWKEAAHDLAASRRG